jgi:hypothetical protein
MGVGTIRMYSHLLPSSAKVKKDWSYASVKCESALCAAVPDSDLPKDSNQLMTRATPQLYTCTEHRVYRLANVELNTSKKNYC